MLLELIRQFLKERTLLMVEQWWVFYMANHIPVSRTKQKWLDLFWTAVQSTIFGRSGYVELSCSWLHGFTNVTNFGEHYAERCKRQRQIPKRGFARQPYGLQRGQILRRRLYWLRLIQQRRLERQRVSRAKDTKTLMKKIATTTTPGANTITTFSQTTTIRTN